MTPLTTRIIRRLRQRGVLTCFSETQVRLLPPGCDPHGPPVSYVTTSGLGNRLRSHLLAWLLAREAGSPLVLAWRYNPQCGADWTDLFEWNARAAPDAREPHVMAAEQFAEIPPWLATGLQVLRAGTPILLDEPHQWRFGRNLHQEAVKRGLLTADDLARALPVRANLAERVAARTTNAPLIGVHVRRGDFVDGHWFAQVKAFPNEAYRAPIDQALIAMGGHARVFLASDDAPESLRELRDRYADRLLYEPAGGRTDHDGIQQALVDLLTLTRCERLVLTPKSSFGELAAMIGGITPERVVEVGDGT